MDKQTTTIRTLLNTQSGIAHFVSGNKTLCGLTIDHKFLHVKTIARLCDVCKIKMPGHTVYIQK
jgi:hypothetical protein